MGRSVMVAQGTLTPYVCVQLTVSQPYGSIAQLAERVAVNHCVLGSNPSVTAKDSNSKFKRTIG